MVYKYLFRQHYPFKTKIKFYVCKFKNGIYGDSFRKDICFVSQKYKDSLIVAIDSSLSDSKEKLGSCFLTHNFLSLANVFEEGVFDDIKVGITFCTYCKRQKRMLNPFVLRKEAHRFAGQMKRFIESFSY